jgi:hypothetical protein
MGFEGFKRQIDIIEGLKREGVIDRYYFVSSVSQFGLAELRQHIISLDFVNPDSLRNSDLKIDGANGSSKFGKPPSRAATL